MKKRIFTSDWHLVDGSKAEDTTNPKQLPEFLEKIDRDNEAELFLVGDIVDLNQAYDVKRNSIFDIFRLDSCDLYKFIKDAHPQTISKVEEMLASGKARYVRGNHDVKLAKLWKRFKPESRLFVPMYGGNNLEAEHGHLYSAPNLVIGNPKIEEPALRFLGLLERYFNKDIDVWFEHLTEKKNGKEYKHKDKFYKNVEQSLSSRRNVRFLVLGHTHDTYFEQISRDGECMVSNKIENLPYVRKIDVKRNGRDQQSQYIINCGSGVNGHEDAVALFKHMDKYFVVFDNRNRILDTTKYI
ncbi:MAG: metallophosphoesterase [Candidatus Aenigmatarchaeota archaeon]